jgi:hypothetical protein
MLRWYPSRWRARYGAEFAAMIEDDLAGNTPTLRYRLSIARSGLIEQMRSAGLVGDSVPPAERVRGAAVTVLCAFALFIIPGVAFAKISEHWDQAIHRGSRHLPAVSFNLLASLAVGCGLALVLAAAALLPLFVQFLRDGGWPAISRRVWWAIATSATTGAVVGGLVIWAGHLTGRQRNVGFGWYQLLFVVAAVSFVGAVASWVAAAISATRHLNMRLGQLRVVGILAALVAVCMPAMTAAAALWWGSMATVAPWFLGGTAVGTSSSPLAANLFVVLIVMTIASGAGVLGLLQVVRTWRHLRST